MFRDIYVLTAGICAAILFDTAFTFLERYVLLFASNKIDIRVATRTFGHLLSLPIDFSERSSAGVLVKHMQQGERIRRIVGGSARDGKWRWTRRRYSRDCRR
jgi:ATP-binding cassette subfamily B protein